MQQNIGEHKHCWHIMAECSTTLITGWELRRCCHCNANVRHDWEIILDPNHGRYVGVDKKVYTGSEVVEDVPEENKWSGSI